MKMNEVPSIERPREKLIHYGPEKLSNSELLAILLRSGKKGENVVELARKILKKYGADKLPHLTFQELQECDGLGPAKACEIVACFELGKRLLKDKKSELFLKPEDVFKRYKPKDRLKGLKPEDRLKGLSRKEIEEYLKKI